MTHLEIMQELDRILRYDGQVTDAGNTFDDRKPLYRGIVTSAIWACQKRCNCPPPVLTTISVAAGVPSLALESSHRVWWVLRAWWNDSELAVRPESARLMVGAPSDTGTPSMLRTYGGYAVPTPIPSQSGQLRVLGYRLAPAITSGNETNELEDVPTTLHRSLAVWAAYLFLLPYTEQGAKAERYRYIAETEWDNWRGEALMTSRRTRSPLIPPGWVYPEID